MHPLDFLSGNDVDALAFFPGMAMPLARKLECVETCLNLLTRRFEVRSMEEHAGVVRSLATLRATVGGGV